MNLYVERYLSTNATRQQEMDGCLRRNLEHPLITKVHLFGEEVALNGWRHDKLVLHPVDTRTTFDMLFAEASRDVCIIANADIYFDMTLQKVQSVDLKDTVYCLTRWDLTTYGTLRFYNVACSQDAWIFLAPFQPDVGFPLGIPGCDNRLAHEIQQAGRKPLNPSLSIRACHVHLSKSHTYDTCTTKVPPPYVMSLAPCALLGDKAPLLARTAHTKHMSLPGSSIRVRVA